MLSDLERGRVVLDDDSLRELTSLYELEVGPVVPARSRLIVDLGGGEMRVGETGVPVEDAEIDSVLERYLSLLYLLRNLKPGTQLTLRDPDIAALSEALEHSIAEVEQRLGQLMVATSVETRSRLLSKRLMVPGAGLLVGVTAVGALVIVGGSAADAGKLSTPSLSSAAISAQVDDSIATLRSGSPIRITDSTATIGDRLILPSGVGAEIVDRSADGASVVERSADGASVVERAADDASVVERAADDAATVSASDAAKAEVSERAAPDVEAIAADGEAPAVAAEREAEVETADVAEVSSEAVVDAVEIPEADPVDVQAVNEPEAVAPIISDGVAIEKVAAVEMEAVEEVAAPAPAPQAAAVDAASDQVEAVQSDAPVAPAEVTDSARADVTPPVAPVQVPAIVIPQATETSSIRVIVPDEPAPTAEVVVAAARADDDVAESADQFVVESSALAGPSFIINEAPDDDLVPEVVEIAEAPLIVTASGPYAQLGAEAEAMISYDFRAHLPGWTIRYEGDTPGYRGLTNLPSKTISIYVNNGDTAWDIAEILGHELGHALDVTHLSDNDRYAWLEARNMPSAWWPGDGLSDFHVGAGDWAEGVAAYLIGSPSYSAYGGFSPAQLQLVGELLPR